MQYKAKTLEKYEAEAREMITFYREEILAGRIPEMRLSKGNSKIGRVWNFSTLAILTCGNCDHCKKYCYAVKDAIRFPENVMRSRAINTALLWYAPEALAEQLNEFFGNPRRRNKNFRFNVSGEISKRLLAMIVSIAKRHADYTIWTYTKMYSVVNHHIAEHGPLPENLSIMFSKWDGMPIDNPHGLPIFAVKLKDGNVEPMNWETMFKCPGDCQVCIKSHRGCIAGENTYNDEH